VENSLSLQAVLEHMFDDDECEYRHRDSNGFVVATRCGKLTKAEESKPELPVALNKYPILIMEKQSEPA
jgi:hypothetical protein